MHKIVDQINSLVVFFETDGPIPHHHKELQYPFAMWQACLVILAVIVIAQIHERLYLK